MTEHTTAEVIAGLSTDLTPVTVIAPMVARVRRAAVVSLLAAVAGVALLGLRDDLFRVIVSPMFVAQAAILLALALLATTAALVLSVPGAERGYGVRAAPLLALAGWATVLGARFAATGGSGAQLAATPLHAACGLMIALVAIVPALVLGWMVRRGVPLDAGWTGGLASLAALAFGALGVLAVCPIPSPAHALVAHVFPVIMLAAAATLIFSTRHRWSSSS